MFIFFLLLVCLLQQTRSKKNINIHFVRVPLKQASLICICNFRHGAVLLDERYPRPTFCCDYGYSKIHFLLSSEYRRFSARPAPVRSASVERLSSLSVPC